MLEAPKSLWTYLGTGSCDAGVSEVVIADLCSPLNPEGANRLATLDLNPTPSTSCPTVSLGAYRYTSSTPRQGCTGRFA